MNEAIQQKPTSVKVLGWFAIAISVMMLFAGLLGSLMFSFIMSQTGENPFENGNLENVPSEFGVFAWMFKHFLLFGIIQMTVSIVMLVSGIQFLRLRAWARTSLETFSWVFLAALVVFTVLWIEMWIGMMSKVPAENSKDIPFAITWVGPVMASFVNGIHATLLIIAIRVLRSDKVRSAMLPS